MNIETTSPVILGRVREDPGIQYLSQFLDSGSRIALAGMTTLSVVLIQLSWMTGNTEDFSFDIQVGSRLIKLKLSGNISKSDEYSGVAQR